MVTQRIVELLRLRRSWLALAGLALLATLAWLVYRPAVAQDDVVVKAYPCPAGQASDIAEHLREELGSADGVRVAADSRTSQVVVQAPKSIQLWIAKRLAVASDVRGAALGGGADRARGEQTRSVALRRISADQLESSLGDLLRDRLTPITTSREQVRAYRVSLASGNLDLAVDAATAQVKITGTGPAVDAAARLVEILDGPPEEGRSTRLLPVHTAHFDDIQRAATAIRTVSDSASGTPSRRAVYQSRNTEVAQAAPTMPTAVGPPAAPPGIGPGVAPGAEASPAAPEGGAGLVNPVQVETLPGLNVMVIKGNPADVALIEAFIHQVELLSKLTQPVIKIIPVRQVDCEQLAALISTLYDQVYRARQGDVSITPIVTPNELLVVGRAENVKTVETLVDKLDQPAVPDAQFRVFQLRYASPATAQTAIQSFFATRGGLSPVVNVTIDARTNTLIVQASPRDMQQVAEIITRLDTKNGNFVSEVRFIKLEHATASDVAAIMQSAIGAATGGATVQQQGGFGAQPQATSGTAGQQAAMIRFLKVDSRGRRLMSSGILSGVKITTDPRANALVVTAPSEDMDLIETLVHEIDLIPAAEAQIKVFTVVNGDATNLATMLEQLFGLPTTTQGGGGGFGGALGQIVQTTTAGNETSVVQLHFAVDVRTNSIIASGTMGDLAVVEAVLTKLDAGDVRTRKSVVLRLKNSPATDVANTLNTYLTTQRTFDQSAPGLTSVYEEFEREVTIVPEPVTNSLVLSATPRYFEEVKGIIEQLDARPLMVTIQVLIASIDLGDTNEFGIELGLQDSTLFDRSVLSNPVVTSTTLPTGTTTQTVIAANNAPGFNFNDTSNPLGNSGLGTNLNPSTVAGQSLTNFAVGRQSSLGYGGLVLSAQSQNVSALIRALAENHKVEVLERPQITTLDNQPANVQIGQNVPTITTVNNSAVTGQVNSITYTKVGVILGVTPRISPDGLVVMQIDAEKSVLEPEATGIPIFSSPTGQVVRSPIIDSTTAQTTVSAMDGQTIVLGGLISKNKNESHRSVPWLGDLPLIGNLFRFDSTSCERTELLIIMTPHIIRTAADAEALKREEAARMSWCLCDVIKIHGEAGLNPRGGAWGAADVKVVYPDSPEITLPGEHVAPEAVPAPSGQPHAPATTVPQPSNQPIVPPLPSTAPPQTSPPQTLSPPPSSAPVQSSGATAPSPGDPISGSRQYGPAPAGDLPVYPQNRTQQMVEPAAYQRPDAYYQTQGNPGEPQPAVYQQPAGQAPYQPQFER